jgi:hypothetical protein
MEAFLKFRTKLFYHAILSVVLNFPIREIRMYNYRIVISIKNVFDDSTNQPEKSLSYQHEFDSSLLGSVHVVIIM